MSAKPQETVLLVGVGGMGMAPLAIYLAQQGKHVYGYDDAINPAAQALLSAAGVELLSTEAFPVTVQQVVVSSAIEPTHPCYLLAQERGLPVVSRGIYLSELSFHTRLIAIVGSHGKTTTASMLVSALDSIGFPFDYILGGFYREGGGLPARFTSSEYLVAEVDESDGSIETFSPEVTLALNFDWDHVARYPSEGDLENAFKSIFSKTKSKIIYWGDDAKLTSFLEAASCQTISFRSGGAYSLSSESVDFFRQELILSGQFPACKMALPVGGHYNARNALAALTVVAELGEPVDNVSMDGYVGVRRRQDLLYNQKDFWVFADYAHHPTEIEALLAQVRSSFPGHLVTAVFEPHRYTRTQHLAPAFAAALKAADRVHLLPVYAASEHASSSGESDAILRAWAGDTFQVTLWGKDDLDALRQSLVSLDQKKPHVLLFVGAGSIDHFASRCFDADLPKQLGSQLSQVTLLTQNEPLAKKTTLRVGGVARYYAEPANVEDLQSLLASASLCIIPVFLLGRGSNVIIADEGFSGLVLRLNHPNWRSIEALGSGRFRVGAGTRLKELCGIACKEGYGGFEFLEGIPGSLGGALRMNAGAMGGWMFDIVESIEWVTAKGEFRQDAKEAFHVSYRKCEELLSGFAVSAIVRAPEVSTQEQVASKIKAFAALRKESQPRDPSAGCMFKNPPNGFAGKLVDELGLKGFSCGDAEVSSVHGNFIINRGRARCSDVLSLVRHVHQAVHKRYGITLEPEVLLLGKQWEDVLHG